MTLTIEATYKDGVFIPVQRVDLADDERVRLTVEVPALPDAVEVVRRWRGNRIEIDPQIAREIALSPEFHPDES
jgi:predicted DNA-binding antitoxin AbrB/MazE fold protein